MRGERPEHLGVQLERLEQRLAVGTVQRSLAREHAFLEVLDELEQAHDVAHRAVGLERLHVLADLLHRGPDHFDWNMIEREQIASMFKHDRGEAFVLCATFLLTVFEDITVGIGVGVSLGSLLFMHRMAEAVEIEAGGTPATREDEEEDDAGACYLPARPDAIMTYRINGPFFFGVAATISAVLDAIGPRPEAFILDLTAAPLADATAADALRTFAQKEARRKTAVYIVGANERVLRALAANGVEEPLVSFAESELAARALISSRGSPGGREGAS